MMTHFLLSLVAVATTGAYPVPLDTPHFESRMVCPEGGPFRFSHGSTVVYLGDGRLVCAWSAGSRETGDDALIAWSELPAGAANWTEPEVLVDTPEQSDWNPVLFQDGDGVLWLFYQTMEAGREGPTRPNTSWTTCKVKAITSKDGGETWSEERVLIDEPGYLTRNKPAVLRNGTILLPIHDARNWTSQVLISPNKGETWDMSQPIDCGLGFEKGNIEPALLERDDGSILCLMRTGSQRYRAWKSLSYDSGRTWSPPIEIEAPNPNAAFDLLRLRSGPVLMALNPEPEGDRRRLSVWLSLDDGESWVAFRDVENGEEYASYPALTQSRDDRIHMTYSRPNGGIKHVTFNEAWVWETALVKGEFKPANVVPALDDPDDPRARFRRDPGQLPIEVGPFGEHVRGAVENLPAGPIMALAVDDEGCLKVATIEGIFRQDKDGSWQQIQQFEKTAWRAHKAAYEGAREYFGKYRFSNRNGWGPRSIFFKTPCPSFRPAENKPKVRFVSGLFDIGGHNGYARRDTGSGFPPGLVNALVWDGQDLWLGLSSGLFSTLGYTKTPLGVGRWEGFSQPASWRDAAGQPKPDEVRRWELYGQGGPLATEITALAVDSGGTLWVGTPLGLSVRKKDGAWSHIRGKEGLPYEEVTAIAIDGRDRLWIGTSRGAIHYRPYEDGRQWFYRAGKRYLPGDYVYDVAVTLDGKTAYFATNGGVGRIDEVATTLLAKAETIERRINERHRRLGLVAECDLGAVEGSGSHAISDNDNDGLWTAYHVAAMSLCYAVTGEEEALRSAKESMHALYMLQNASGTPGLVARSVVPAEIGKTKDAQWRPTPDGTMYWKSDTSSDEIDGHYLAFYTYWEHIARFIPEERELCVTQVRALTDYLVDNGYVLIDWDGERTRWGFWSPELLNEDPEHYLENGLNSLQMLSFLKVAHHITADPKYKEHYDRLVTEHNYLSNVLLSKKLFPDENNHSDDQLGYVAWYPILQLERDPKARQALRAAVRRHYKIVAPEKPSFYAFVTATIDPDYVDVEAAVENLREIPTDRRNWRMENSHRADVVFSPFLDRFGKRQLLEVLPADERDFAKWNRNPYVPDEGGDGRHENDGAAYLLPYWMGRYHGIIREQAL